MAGSELSTAAFSVVRWMSMLALLVMVAGCAVNPVTGRSDFVLMTEEQEIALGRNYQSKVLEQYSRYDDAALQAYVQQVGERLGAHSHRSNLIYRFTVLDSPEVNAFALPGGYIYITRGLLAYLNSEAELAAVLGHEIGHVTARHAVRQHSAATATGLLGSVAAATLGVRGAEDIFSVLGSALISGYGREHELESDRLGAEYLARSGYDPKAMLEVIGVLKDQELFELQQAKAEQREPRVYHGVFATHPDNDARLQEVVSAAGRVQAGPAAGTDPADFLHKLDGLTFGDSESEGIRRENRFYHRDLNFALTFPSGWVIENSRDRITARSPAADALMQVGSEELNQRMSPREFMHTRLRMGEDLRNGEEIRHNGLIGYTAIADGQTPFGTRPMRVTVIYYDNRAYIFIGASKDGAAPYAYDRAFLDTAQSFHALTEQERRLARAQRLSIIRAAAGTRMETLARNSPVPNYPLEQLRLLNGLYPDGQPTPGQMLKIVE